MVQWNNMTRRIRVIINPAAGQKEPILPTLNAVFSQYKVEWDVCITHKDGDAANHAAQAVKEEVDCVAVYGGDGTVVEAAQVLMNQSIPLGIIPGGSSNVLAKELGIPTGGQKDESIRLIATKEHQTFRVDAACCNNQPLLFMLTMGVYADIIQHTQRELKYVFGQFAYNLAAVDALSRQQQETYTITVDGTRYKEKAAGIVVANAGNIGIPGIQMAPNIYMDDGMFDIILLRDTSPITAIEFAQSTLLQQEWQNAVKHWQGSHITITSTGTPSIVRDDKSIKTHQSSIDIQVEKKALPILVP